MINALKKHQLKYRGKLILYFVIAFAIYILVSIIVLISNEKKSQTSAKIDVLRTYTLFIERQLANDTQYASTITGLPSDYRVTILTKDGDVLFDNIAIPGENHLNREEITKSMETGEGFAIRKSETTNTDYLYYARKTGNDIYIRLAMPHGIKLNNLLQTNKLLLYLSIFVFLVTLMILIYSTDKYWSVMRTLKNFTTAAENGDIDYNSVHFPDTDSGEIGNKMVSLYKELETSKQEIIREKDLNRQLKQEMTNNIAHELKTPVSSIRGYLEILLGDKPVSDERRHYFLERSYFQTLRLSNLINDVSIINKIEESSELFTKEMLNVRNVSNEADMGLTIPVVITVYADRSFSFICKTPPAAVLLKKAAGIDTASGVPQRDKVATISAETCRKIAEQKMPDLNAASVDAAYRMIKGTARSMGIVVEEG